MADFDQELKKLMQETVSEMGDYFKNFEDKFQNNQKRFEGIQQKLYGHIEKKCTKEVEWLKNNSAGDSKEFQSKIKDFETCAGQNDFGFSNFVQDLTKDQEAHAAKEQKCVLDCRNNNKGNQEIKDCLKKCLISSTDAFTTMYDQIDVKLNEINNKF
jgi:hypothetical protein